MQQGVYTYVMNETYPIASVAELISDPARAAMLIALLDGGALPAGELARIAGISAQSASGHLSKLVDGGLLAVQSEGRHRYYKIASAEVGHAMEALGAIATIPKSNPRITIQKLDPLQNARTCYDHLAGRVAVEITNALEKSKVICPSGESDYELGHDGDRWFCKFGVDVGSLRGTRRCFARRCLDWTERKPHLAGALGSAFCSRVIALGWVARRPNSRGLRITEGGERELRERFGISVYPWIGPPE
jgi:DNA-binding transcriptional ArsR family regulator